MTPSLIIHNSGPIYSKTRPLAIPASHPFVTLVMMILDPEQVGPVVLPQQSIYDVLHSLLALQSLNQPSVLALAPPFLLLLVLQIVPPFNLLQGQLCKEVDDQFRYNTTLNFK